MATRDSKREEIRKTNPQKADKYDFMPEWDLYEPITCKTTLIKGAEDRSKLLKDGQKYITYDHQLKSFIGMVLDANYAHNFFIVDDSAHILPKKRKAPSELEQFTDFKSFLERTLQVTLWVNERRF